MTRLGTRLAAAALLLAVVIGFYWKLTLTRDYTWLDNPDLVYQALPWFQFQASQIHQGHLPLWDPQHWGGQSLIGQLQPGTAYPLNWILFALPLRDGRIQPGFLNAYFVAIHFLGALFAYWLCRDLRRTRPASLLSGVCFGLGGFLGNAAWPGLINGVVWTPLVFLFLLRAARGRRPVSSAALSGLFCGIAFLAGHHLPPTLTLLAAGGVWAYLVFRAGRLDWRFAGLGAVALVFTLLAGSLQILPAYEYGTRAIRWVGAPDAVAWNQRVPYSVHSDLSFGAHSLLGLVVPGIHSHENPFIGVTALSLAFLALAVRWKWRSVRLLAAVALGGLLFALGRDSVFHGVLYSLLPMIEKAREPSRAIFLFHFGIAALAAYGVDSLRKGGDWLLRISAALAALGALPFLLWKPQPPLGDRALLAGLTSLLLAGVLFGFYRGALSRRAGVVSLVGLAIFELGYGAGPPMSEKSQAATLKKLSDHADIVGFLRRQPGLFRVEVDDQEIPYNFGDWHGLEDMGGYFPSVPINVWKMGALANRSTIYGVAYTVTKKPPAGAQELVFESPGGLKVYRNPGAFPRVWTVHETVMQRPGGGLDRPIDARRVAFLPGAAPALEVCGGEDYVRVAAHSPGRVVIEADMRCTGMVVLSDNHFPGWKARLDGVSVPILPAYLSMRGVVTPFGSHRIEMEYRPWPVWLGALLSCLGVLGAAALAIRDARFRQ